MDENWNLNALDRIRLYEINPDNLLSIVAKCKKGFEPLPIYQDSDVPAQTKAQVVRILLLLQDEGLIVSNDFKLKWTITTKGKFRLFYNYGGWPFIATGLALVALIIAILAWLHPIATDTSAIKPLQQDIIGATKSVNSGQVSR